MKRICALLLTGVMLLSAAGALAVDGKNLSVQMVDYSGDLERLSDQRCSFQCSYMNNNPEKTVAGIDLCLTAMDADYNITMDETTQFIALDIEPGDSCLTPVVYITNTDDLTYLWLAVQTVYFTDGTWETIDIAEGENYKSYVFQ